MPKALNETDQNVLLWLRNPPPRWRIMLLSLCLSMPGCIAGLLAGLLFGMNAFDALSLGLFGAVVLSVMIEGLEQLDRRVVQP
jgi:hypothetical protein